MSLPIRGAVNIICTYIHVKHKGCDVKCSFPHHSRVIRLQENGDCSIHFRMYLSHRAREYVHVGAIQWGKQHTILIAYCNQLTDVKVALTSFRFTCSFDHAS